MRNRAWRIFLIVGVLAAGITVFRAIKPVETGSYIFVPVERLLILRKGAEAIRPQQDDGVARSGDNSADILTKNRKDSEKKVILGKLSALNDSIASISRLKQDYRFDLIYWNDMHSRGELRKMNCRGLYECTSKALDLLGANNGENLRKSVWIDDVTSKAARKDEFWKTHVVKISDGILDEQNPWRPLSGPLLVKKRTLRSDKEKYLIVSREGSKFLVDKEGKSPLGINMDLISSVEPGFLLPGVETIGRDLAELTTVSKHQWERNNTIRISNKDVPIGYSAVLTLDPSLQAKAQKIIRNFIDDGSIKMAAISVIDIESGGISVAASDDTEEWRSENRMRQGNHALFFDSPPASAAKVLMAVAALEHQLPVNMGIGMEQAIKKSNNDYFLTLALGKTNGVSHAGLLLSQAHRFGWNEECSSPSATCGAGDYLFGKKGAGLPGQQRMVLGRTLVKNEKLQYREYTESDLQNILPYSVVRTRIAQAKNTGNGANLPIETLAAYTAGLGQGETRSTATGLAFVMEHIGAAASGKKSVVRPHLVQDVLDSSGKRAAVFANLQPSSMPVAMSKKTAETIVRYLAGTTSPGGTAFKAFRSVYGSASGSTFVLGKTGTTDSKKIKPYKWFIGLYKRSPESRSYDAAIAVLVELTEKQHEHNFNTAAAIAFSFIRDARMEGKRKP
jgi:hypothetical protein